LSAPYHNKALPQGTILREWRLEEVLGTGGFGIVYRGKGVYFGEDVAIKEYFPSAISDRREGNTVAPNDSDSEEIYELGRQKFLEEAKVLWNLSRPQRHPNIVSVRSLFEIHGTAYMVMDFENGTSLSQMLHQGHKFDEKSLRGIIIPIAEGLDRAHRNGVLHRDIKPANILINEAGRPVLIDFGSARFESGQATNTKVTFYTPPYAALEQYVKTFPQGPWTDIYALGVVLYQCITGEKPAEVLERLHGGLGQALSAKEWPGFSNAFTRAVDVAMGIRPQERPQSISDWLKRFDIESDVNDEATRVGVTIWTDMPTMPVSVAPAPQSAVAAVPAAEAMPPQSVHASGIEVKNGQATSGQATSRETKRPGMKHAVIGSLAALVLVSAVAALVWPRHTSATGPLPASAFASASPASGNTHENLGQALDGLIAAAQKAGRPQGEVTALTDAKTKILAMAAQKTPQAADQANEAARDMAKTEITALGRTARRQWRDLGALPDATAPDAAGTITALKTAKTDLDGKLAADLTTLDALAAAQATQQALDAYTAFQSAYTAAAPVYVTAKKKDLTDLLATAQSTTNQIVALAGVEKPWFLASQQRKQAYELRQGNAAQAKALLTQLNTAASVAQSSKDLKLVSGAIAQMTTAQATLSSLYAASNAAKP
jgi:serine/threonine protein kinase